jgi:hypothetical protein
MSIILRFCQYLGGTLGLSVCEAIFSGQLAKNVAKYAPGAPLGVVEQSPATMRSVIPPDLIGGVVRAYVESLDDVFIICVPLGARSLPFQLLYVGDLLAHCVFFLFFGIGQAV